MNNLNKIEDQIIYNAEAGTFHWAAGTRRAGKEAGYKSKKGYIEIRINGILYLGHRIAWYLTYKTWPRSIDHIDGDPRNNALRNLRDVSHHENTLNSPASRKDNHGVFYQPQISRSNPWKVQFTRHGKCLSFGRFPSKEAAILRAKEVKEKGLV